MTSARQLDAEIAGALADPRTRMAKIVKYVEKYLAILGVGGDLPVIKIRSHLGAGWLGRSTWSSNSPTTTLLELQKSIIEDDRTLERVIAHEVIHHRDALAMTPNELALVKIGIKPDAHGAAFREGAARINAILGEGFVTATSDKEYKQAPSQKEFLLLITPLSHDRLGYAWAARLGPKSTEVVKYALEHGSRLTHTTDERWTRGAKIERFGGYSAPKASDSESIALLRALYDAAKEAP